LKALFLVRFSLTLFNLQGTQSELRSLWKKDVSFFRLEAFSLVLESVRKKASLSSFDWTSQAVLGLTRRVVRALFAVARNVPPPLPADFKNTIHSILCQPEISSSIHAISGSPVRRTRPPASSLEDAPLIYHLPYPMSTLFTTFFAPISEKTYARRVCRAGPLKQDGRAPRITLRGAPCRPVFNSRFDQYQ